MAEDPKSFEERVVLLKRRRCELADKDMTQTENLDIDAFQSLFPMPPAPTASAADFMSRLLQEERLRAEQALAALSEEERQRLFETGQGFLLID